MDVRDMYYHGIRHQVRRVLVALGPERIEKGLTAFEDGKSTWSECFFARAFDNIALNQQQPGIGQAPSWVKGQPKISQPEWTLMHLLGFNTHVPIRIVWNLFDQHDSWRHDTTQLMRKDVFRKFIEDVLDESRPEVIKLLRSLNVQALEDRPAYCVT